MDKQVSTKTTYRLLLLVIGLLVLNVFLLRLDWQNSHRKLTLAMLDVGQGDSIFIESPTGTQIMFDAGSARKILAPLSRIMSPFDRNIDVLVITNPDADHIGGLSDILDTYEVGAVLEPGTWNGSKTFQDLKNTIREKNIPNLLARSGMRLHLGGGAMIDILFPDRDVSDWSPNDGSVVARLIYGDTTVLLMGDSTSKTERIILENNDHENIASIILKVGHHGSRTSSSSALVEAVAPEYALISAGRDNKYGHPHREVLETLGSVEAEILRTDLAGTIIFKCARIGVCEIKKSKN